MRRKPILFALLILAVVAAAVTGRWLTRPDHSQKVELADRSTRSAPGAHALRVYVHRVEPRPLNETITTNGTLLANEAIDLRTEISGKVVDIYFDEGSAVKEGDLLLKINDSELQAQLRQTLVRIDLAKVQEERQRQLIERGGTSRESFDAAVHQVREIQAEADLIRAQLAKTELRAPFSGLIGLRFVSEGSYVTPTTRIATLQQVDRLKIDFSISERYMDRVHSGTQVKFRVAGRPREYTGEVYAVEPTIDVTTRTVLLRARTGNPDRQLLPGAYASVEVVLDEIPNALLVPTTAIVPGINERTLYVLENGLAQPRAVETGIRLDREIQIVRGIEPGTTVITSGLLQLRAGMLVVPIVETESPPAGNALPVARRDS